MHVYIYIIMHILLLQVVLEGLISRELIDFMIFWNSHKIRTESALECPSGIPNDLYDIPENHGTYKLINNY